jgi:glycerol-3-phosphate cytidylyltransferase-like family protein
MKIWKITFLSLALLLLILIWIFVFGINSNQPGQFFNKNSNAIWIEHKWVEEDISEKEISDLVFKLSEYQFDTVFVHSGPLKADGTIDEQTYKNAERFLTLARKYNEEIKYQAWLGQVRSNIDLSDPFVRGNIVDQAVILTKMIGFDGVHYDIEPVWDGDLDFISLLKETKEVLKDEKIISVALAEFIPTYVIKTLGNFYEFENYNSETNYKNVGEYADQIVVMVYDTSISKSWLYRFLVKEQCIWVSRLYKNKDVFIAIPSYDEVTEAFDPQIENIENGLRGIISGLNNFRSRERNFKGVAIYAYWTTSEEEFETYKNLWVKK